MFTRPSLKGAHFDDQQIEAMADAFAEATAVLRFKPGTPRIVYQAIVLRIIEAAKDGERDPHKLCKLAFEALKDSKVRRGRVAGLIAPSAAVRTRGSRWGW